MTKINVELSIFGDHFDTEELTNILGVLPTSTSSKGDIIRENLTYKETSWNYSTGLTESWHFDEIMEIIIRRFENKEHLIASYAQEHNLESKIFAVIEIEKDRAPSIVLDRRIIGFSTAIDAIFDIDTYVL